MKLIDWVALQRVIGVSVWAAGEKGRHGGIDILPLASSRKPMPNLWEIDRKKEEGKLH